MKTQLTPYYIELVYEACLKSFWRKKALANFLRQCGVPDSFIATWGPDESKRDLLDRLFLKLPRSDHGRQELIRIANALMEKRTFPDLQNWEESAEKIKDAKKSVSDLKHYHDRQQEEIQTKEERKRTWGEFRKKQNEISRSQESLQKLSNRLNELGTNLGEQKAGYDFQTWFYDLLDFCEIQNRRPYINDGRQIDGSLTLSGTTYLVELKFTRSPSEPVAIGDFFKKVTTKADNTMGVFVSISGYTDVAKKEASSAKTPLLLLDHSHLYLVLGGIMGMGDVIERIRRHASQTGEAYLDVNDFSG